jgi:beta-glucosidase-like glycosyl hydrolase
VAREQGRLTGAALRDLGINVDLAPVADPPFSTASLLYRQGRTFTFDADLNAMLVDAFAAGLGASGTLIGELLHQEMGFGGVSITDSLTGAAAARGVSESSLAIKAAAAGTDLILVTDGEPASATVYADLLAAARDGRVGSIALRASFDRIMALKARLPSGSAGR